MLSIGDHVDCIFSSNLVANFSSGIHRQPFRLAIILNINSSRKCFLPTSKRPVMFAFLGATSSIRSLACPWKQDRINDKARDGRGRRFIREMMSAKIIKRSGQQRARY